MTKKGRKRTSYSDDFKARAVKALSVPGASVKGVAGDLKVHPTQLRQWKAKAEANGGAHGRALGRKAQPRSGRGGALLPMLEAEVVRLERSLAAIRTTISILRAG